jgi:hypothetical protein
MLAAKAPAAPKPVASASEAAVSSSRFMVCSCLKVAALPLVAIMSRTRVAAPSKTKYYEGLFPGGGALILFPGKSRPWINFSVGRPRLPPWKFGQIDTAFHTNRLIRTARETCCVISDVPLSDYGIDVQPINYPTVPRGAARLRIRPVSFQSPTRSALHRR